MLPPDRVPERTAALARPIIEAAIKHHHYRVQGIDRVPTQGPALIVFNHSLATYDIFLFGASVYLKTGRLINSLADRAIFATPGLAQIARHLGAIQGEPTNARRLLDAGRLVGVAPGGMREALRPSHQRYALDWERRFGFAKLAMEARVPVILAACPAADDIFDVVGNPLTELVYNKFRLPLPVVKGVHAPKLTHYVSEPIMAETSDVVAFQRQLTARMTELMAQRLGGD